MKVLFLVFLSILLFQEAQPEVAVDVGTVEPNQVAVIRVTVTNPNTADMLWNNMLRIEETHPYFVPIREEYTLSHEIRPGQTDIGELTFQVTREAQAGSYPLTISLSGGVGACQEGCVPYFVEKEVSVKVVRDEPTIDVTHVMSRDQIVVTLKNTGTGKAQEVTIEGILVGTIRPGEQAEVTVENQKSSFTVAYEDDYGKKFTQAYRISEKKPEKDSPTQTGLCVAGILFAYLFKRGRN